ncbi:MAG: hypothetical protein NTX22_08220 [Ignavibacteriales bacterium]|nr:hypothetical protein [Ignavibacteriales bacterium]
MKKIFYAFVILFMSISFWQCSSTKDLASIWNDKKITIDGNQEDWQNKLNYNTDENIAYGFCNDDENLYLCITTGERARMFQIIRSGFTIWFETIGTDGKTIGIKYPIGESAFNRDESMNINRDEMEKLKMEEIINKFQLTENEFSVLNKEKFPLTAFNLQNKAGIEIKLGYHLQQFVYEMKIPLKGLSPKEYCVNANPGDVIKVGFQTEEFNRERLGNKNMGDGMGQGMAGGRRGGKSMGGGGNRKGNFPQQLKQLDFQVKLTLVSSTGVIQK